MRGEEWNRKRIQVKRWRRAATHEENWGRAKIEN